MKAYRIAEIVDAYQWREHTPPEQWPEWLRRAVASNEAACCGVYWYIPPDDPDTPLVSDGDWIILGENGYLACEKEGDFAEEFRLLGPPVICPLCEKPYLADPGYCMTEGCIGEGNNHGSTEESDEIFKGVSSDE